MNVYFTVDTESSMGGAWLYPERRPLTAERHIFCRIGSEDYGIGLITRILSGHGFRATHFVETLAALVNGEDDTRRVFEYLMERKQDVQLHIHPTYQFYAEALHARAAGRSYTPPDANDLMKTFDEKGQAGLLETACTLFRRFTGSHPAAFRAGCYAANRITLRCLRNLGFRLDTSFNPCYPEVSFSEEGLQPNRVCEMEGIWELPVTVARSPLREGCGFKPADPCALSVNELKTMLETGAAQGQRHFVMVFHSFSAVKPKDIAYSAMKPDRIVIRRLELLMKYLAGHPQLYRVATFGELAAELSGLESNFAPVAALPLLPAGIRKSIQGINRYYW